MRFPTFIKILVVISSYASLLQAQNDCNQLMICDDLNATTLSPISTENGLTYDCIQSCLDLESEVPLYDSICDLSDKKVAWFKIETDTLAEILFIKVDPLHADWIPAITLFEGDCDGNLIPVYNYSSDNCNLFWGGGAGSEIIRYDVQPETEYYLGITGIYNETPKNTEFSLCVSSRSGFVVCRGKPDCSPDVDFRVISRSADPNGDLNLPLEGPFLSEEKVTICVDHRFDYSESGAFWLHGIVPVLGSGWNLDLFDPITTTVLGNGIEAEWFGQDSETPPISQVELNTKCTYELDGRLVLCNLLCEDCPCSNGITPDSPLPGGWFWNTDGNFCDSSLGPSNSWGIGSPIADVQFCLELTVKAFEDDCANLDLMVGFHAFTDDITGCWENPSSCTHDIVQVKIFYPDCPGLVFDIDGDGYINVVDCDDYNPNLGVEIPTYYQDLDQDGYGDDDVFITQCDSIPGYVLIGGDCDDANAEIYPTAIEIPNNGIDENCDGVDLLSSINTIDNGRKSLIVVNPVGDLLRLNMVFEYLEVYNSKGLKVLSNYKPQLDIDVEHLSPGIYFMITFDESIIRTEQFIKL